MGDGDSVEARAEGARIGIVDDHAAVGVGIEALLGGLPGIGEIVCAATVAELLGPDRARGAGFDLAILDLRLADGSTPRQNVDALHGVGAEVLAYTAGESPSLVREAARAGIVGLIRKSEPLTVLEQAVRAALRGEIAASTEWAAAIDADPDGNRVALSPREREVLSLYASGEQADRVGRLLGISRETVLDHIRRIRSKYTEGGRPAPTKVHLYQRAVEDGLLPGQHNDVGGPWR